MNTNDIDSDLQQLRTQWQSLSKRVDGLEKSMATAAAISRYDNSRRRLSRIFLGMIWASIICLLWIPAFLYFELGMPLLIVLLSVAYFALTAVNSVVLYSRTRKVDLSRMDSATALRSVYSVIRFRRLSKTVIIIFAAILIPMIIYQFHTISEPMFIGGLAGIVIGLPIALTINRRQQRILSDLRKSLEDTAGA